MDLFDAYPEMRSLEHDDFKDKSLRLIGLSGLAQDDTHFYFELSEPKMWGTLDGTKVIGIGTARMAPNGQQPVHAELVNYIRHTWRCDVHVEPVERMIIMNAVHQLSTLDTGANSYPFITILTEPRLGGSVMPDALVQILYQMRITRTRSSHRTNLVRIVRHHLAEFLNQEIWDLDTLKSVAWADVRLQGLVPADAKVRPVLGLRALKAILDAGLYSIA